MVKDQKTNLIKLVLNTFISIKGPIILQNCPILSPSEPDQLIQLSGNRGWPTSPGGGGNFHMRSTWGCATN